VTKVLSSSDPHEKPPTKPPTTALREVDDYLVALLRRSEMDGLEVAAGSFSGSNVMTSEVGIAPLEATASQSTVSFPLPIVSPSSTSS
jgi:hypothetical protein